MKAKLFLIAIICVSLTACKANKQEPIIEYLPPNPVTETAKPDVKPVPSPIETAPIETMPVETVPTTDMSVAILDDVNFTKFSKQRFVLPSHIGVQSVASKNNIKSVSEVKDPKTGAIAQISKEINISYPQLTGFSNIDFQTELNNIFVSKVTKEELEKTAKNGYYYQQGFLIGHEVGNICQIFLNTYKLIDGDLPYEVSTSVSFDCQSGQVYDTPTTLRQLGYNSLDVLSSINKAIGNMKDSNNAPLKKLDTLPSYFYFDNNNLVMVYNAIDSKTKVEESIPLLILRKAQ
jgi:hypothetical protein